MNVDDVPVSDSKLINRLGFLDGMRGVAALYTVIFHVAVVPIVPQPMTELPKWFAKFVLFGHSGVTLFFVISGFSLCLAMPGHLSSCAPHMSYGLARYFRIAPLFYVLLGVTLFRNVYFDHLTVNFLDVFLNLSFSYNLLIHKWIGIVMASWTLGVEMIFYLIFPIIYKFSSKLENLILILVVSILAGTIFSALFQVLRDDYVYRSDYIRGNFFTHLPSFIVGMIACRIYQIRYFIMKNRDIRLPIGILGLGGLCIALAKGGEGLLSAVDNAFQLSVFYAMALIGCSALKAPVFFSKGARFFGRISYSLYLWHVTIIFALSPLYAYCSQLFPSPGIRYSLWLLVTLCIVVPIAWLSYRLIEKPGMLIGSSLRSRLLV